MPTVGLRAKIPTAGRNAPLSKEKAFTRQCDEMSWLQRDEYDR